MKILQYLLLTSLLLLLMPTHTLAAAGEPWINGVTTDFQNYDKYTTLTVTPGMAMSLASNIVSPVKYVDGIPTPVLQNSLGPNLNHIIGMTYEYQPGAREYIADLKNSIGFPEVKSAYAQGIGYQKLNPLSLQ